MVSPLTHVFQSDPKLGKELANVKGFGEIDHSAWITGTQTCFHTGCSGACATRKTFQECPPTATVAPQRQSFCNTKAPNAVATFATRGSLKSCSIWRSEKREQEREKESFTKYF